MGVSPVINYTHDTKIRTKRLSTRHSTNLTDTTRNTVHTGLLATTDYRQPVTRTPNRPKLSLPECPAPTPCIKTEHANIAYTKLRHWAWFSSVDCLRLRASVTTLALPGWYWIYNRKHLSQQNFWFVSLFKSCWSNKYSNSLVVTVYDKSHAIEIVSLKRNGETTAPNYNPWVG